MEKTVTKATDKNRDTKNYLTPVKEKFREIVEFLKDTRKELFKVSWPGRKEVISTTIVVIVSVFFFGFFLFVVDALVNTGMNYVLKLNLN